MCILVIILFDLFDPNKHLHVLRKKGKTAQGILMNISSQNIVLPPHKADFLSAALYD